MISTITELKNNTFSGIWEINTQKSKYPVNGDIYYDPQTHQTWCFDGDEWCKLQIMTKNFSTKANDRKEKIISILDEEES
jgi:hypothetical protein